MLCQRKKLCVSLSMTYTVEIKQEGMPEQNSNNEAVSVILSCSTQQEAFVVSNL